MTHSRTGVKRVNAPEIAVYLQQMEDLMARLQRIMSHDKGLKKLNMTASQMFILRYLDKREHAKASDIAHVAGLSPGAVTQVCDELERSGWVERSRSNEDRRVVYVAITAGGKQRLVQIRQLRSAEMMDIFSQLGESDTSEFLRIMGHVVDIIERRHDHGERDDTKGED